jgi:titin
MKKVILMVILVLLIFYCWQCAEKNPLEITGSKQLLTVPKSHPLIAADGLIDANGSSVPGYINGNIRSDRVTLSWAASSDADFIYYKLIRDGNTIDNITSAATTTYIDSNWVQQNTRYTYMVANVVRNGTALVDTIEIKTPRFETPFFAGDEYQILPTTYDVRLIWENSVESASSYEVFKSTRWDSTYYKIGTTNMGDTTFTDTQNTVLGRTFYYKVYGSNQFEHPDTSNILIVPIFYSLNTPTISAAYEWWNRLVRIQWTDNSTGEDGFKIFRGATSGNLEKIAEVTTNITEYLDRDISGFMPDSTYYYYIRAYNSVDESANSNTVGIVYFEP